MSAWDQFETERQRVPWKAIDPKTRAAAAEKRREEETAARREKQGIRLGPPGWHYEPAEGRWHYRGEPGLELTLCWLSPSHGCGAEWRYRYRWANGRIGGGGIQGRVPRIEAMGMALRDARGVWR